VSALAKAKGLVLEKPAEKWTVWGCGEVAHHMATVVLVPLQREGQRRGRACSQSRKRTGLLF